MQPHDTHDTRNTSGATAPLKKKKFSGHLRNNSRKKQNPAHSSEPSMTLHDECTQDSPSPKPVYHELFSLLRQKFSASQEVFFTKLQQVLQIAPWSDIRDGKMTLFSYSALYEKSDILRELGQRFPQEVRRDDFEDCILPMCLNKHEGVLVAALEVLGPSSGVSTDAISRLMTQMSKMSYRQANNQIMLDWLTPALTPGMAHFFWSQALKEKNIALVNVALQNPLLRDCLRNDWLQLEPALDAMGKKIEISRKLQTRATPAAVQVQPVPSGVYLSDASEQMQHITQESVATKVTIKKRKVVA